MKSILQTLTLIFALTLALARANAQAVATQNGAPPDTSNNATPDTANSAPAVTANDAPPPLPDYEQPACPTDGYLWQPGYWAYDPAGGYYWVPGVWTAAPAPGMLWTPAFWAFVNGVFVLNQGYWAPTVGFYGGIDYGYGYGGSGYTGGVWLGGSFRYNTAVINVNTAIIRHTYVDRTAAANSTVINHTSFNGRGGIVSAPKPGELAAMRGRHFPPTREQLSNQQAARTDGGQFYKQNQGHPTNVAINKVGGTSVGGGARGVANPGGTGGANHIDHAVASTNTGASNDKGRRRDNEQAGRGGNLSTGSSTSANPTTTSSSPSATTSKTPGSHIEHAVATSAGPGNDKGRPVNMQAVRPGSALPAASSTSTNLTAASSSPAATAEKQDGAHDKHAVNNEGGPANEKMHPVNNDQRLAGSRLPPLSSTSTNPTAPGGSPAATPSSPPVSHIRHAITTNAGPANEKGRAVDNAPASRRLPALPSSYANRAAPGRAPSASPSAPSQNTGSAGAATNAHAPTTNNSTAQGHAAPAQRQAAPAQRQAAPAARRAAPAPQPRPVTKKN